MGANKPAEHGKFIPISVAVKMYPFRKDWYYNHIKNNTLPFPWYPLCVGKRFVKASDIEAYIERIKVPAGSMPKEAI